MSDAVAANRPFVTAAILGVVSMQHRPPERLAVLAWLVFLASVPATAYDSYTAVGPLGKDIVGFVREANSEVGFRGAVLAASGGGVIAAVAVGSSDAEGGPPLTVNTLFEIASCTKPFTAVAVMKLVEDHKLALDDPIAKLLPGVPESCSGVTVRHLLQHTSGIPGTNTKGYGTDLATVLPTFLEGGPRNTPGERHEYWNQGYALLSEIIARASGVTYTRYVQEAIFNPCKMTSTRFTGQRGPSGILVATGISEDGADRTALEHPYGEYGFQYRGMGGIATSLIDLWRWDRSVAKGTLLSEESIAEMATPGPNGYALGWRIRRLESGATVHEHTGRVRGFLASIRRNPEVDGCLFILSNSDSSAPFNVVKQGCERLLAGEKPLQIVKTSGDMLLGAELLSDVEGVYRDDRGRVLTITRKGVVAKATINWGGPITHGFLGSGERDDLLFGTMPRWNPKGFTNADQLTVEREGERVTAVVLRIVANNSSVRFARVAK